MSPLFFIVMGQSFVLDEANDPYTLCLLTLRFFLSLDGGLTEEKSRGSLAQWTRGFLFAKIRVSLSNAALGFIGTLL